MNVLGEVVRPNGRVLKKKRRLLAVIARNLCKLFLTGTWRKASLISREAIHAGRLRVLRRTWWFVSENDGELMWLFRLVRSITS